MSKPAVFLMIDDDEDDISFFEDILHQVDKNITLLRAESGQHAFAQLQCPGAVLPDLIFLDLNMPQMSGKDFLAQLQKEKRLAQIPVIIFTTSMLKRDIRETLDLGAVCFVTKPASVHELKAFIHAVIFNFPFESEKDIQVLTTLSFVIPNKNR